MAKVQERARAVSLRRQGLTYREIMQRIPSIASKGTLSYWCNRIALTPEQLTRIEKRMQVGRDRARFQAILTNRRKREERDNAISTLARQQFETFKDDPFFMFGLALYWAEGSKKFRRFQFMNSDPKLIKMMVWWLEKYLRISKDNLQIRLYIHKVYSHEHCEDYWSQLLDIARGSLLPTVYKPTSHTVKKNPEYKGCVRIDARRTEPWLIVMEWQKCLAKIMRL